MEPEGAASEASWHSFDPSVAAEDSEAMAQLLGVQYFGNEQEQKPAMYWPNHEADQNFSYYNSSYYLHQPNSGASSSTSNTSYLLSANANYEGYYICSDGNGAVPGVNSAMPGDFFVAPEEQMPDPSFILDLNLQFEDQKDVDGSGDEPSACKKKPQDCKDETVEAIPRKKARTTTAMPVPEKSKNAQSKKAQKGACSRGNEQEGNAEHNGQSSCSYTSEDDSQEMTGRRSNVSSGSKKSSSAANQSGKMRAGRGSAADPQSLYARKRRERINERLKILQNLVPNGTKVDISTMLEEAVRYVKFLQLQIKLLSSDELWMYAPIAYNGVNVGLDLKISPPQ